jgi:hypothetical protein
MERSCMSTTTLNVFVVVVVALIDKNSLNSFPCSYHCLDAVDKVQRKVMIGVVVVVVAVLLMIFVLLFLVLVSSLRFLKQWWMSILL